VCGTGVWDVECPEKMQIKDILIKTGYAKKKILRQKPSNVHVLRENTPKFRYIILPEQL